MHGVFGLRITLGRPFPESLPVVSPTSSPSPLRNSPGFPPGSPRPHRGRTMHATQISTCARNSRRAVPPTSCRSRPPAPCRRRVGHVERCSTWTWGCGRGSTSHPRGNSVRQDTPCHATWQAPRSPTHLPRRRTGHAPHCRQNSPRRTGHGNWLAPPMRRGRSQEATTAKTVDAADERMRTRSRHRNVPRDGWYSRQRGTSVRQDPPCHAPWQTPRSPTHLPQDRWAKTRSADRTTTSPGPAHTLTHTAKLAV